MKLRSAFRVLSWKIYMKGRNHTDLDVDGRMIIKGILKKRTGIKWSPVTRSCNWILYLTILLREEWGIFWPGGCLSASQEKLCFMLWHDSYSLHVTTILLFNLFSLCEWCHMVEILPSDRMILVLKGLESFVSLFFKLCCHRSLFWMKSICGILKLVIVLRILVFLLQLYMQKVQINQTHISGNCL